MGTRKPRTLRSPRVTLVIGVGSVVSTNYGTGPYLVTRVAGPCECAEYLASLDASARSVPAPPSAPHYHLTCRRVGDRRTATKGTSYLNGFTLDGRSVWSKDRLTIHTPEVDGQRDLFIHPFKEPAHDC